MERQHGTSSWKNLDETPQKKKAMEMCKTTCKWTKYSSNANSAPLPRKPLHHSTRGLQHTSIGHHGLELWHQPLEAGLGPELEEGQRLQLRHPDSGGGGGSGGEECGHNAVA